MEENNKNQQATDPKKDELKEQNAATEKRNEDLTMTTDQVLGTLDKKNEDKVPAEKPVTESTPQTGVVTSTVISSSTTDQDQHPGLTKVTIKYPGDFKGTRYFKDGDVKMMSKETAHTLVKSGIATII